MAAAAAVVRIAGRQDAVAAAIGAHRAATDARHARLAARRVADVAAAAAVVVVAAGGGAGPAAGGLHGRTGRAGAGGAGQARRRQRADLGRRQHTVVGPHLIDAPEEAVV